MSNNKKSEELRRLKNFQDEAAKAGLEFEILEIDQESPDFLIKYDGRCVGVEITEIHIDENPKDQSQNDSKNGSPSRKKRRIKDKGSPSRKKRHIKDKIVERAQEQYSSTRSRSIYAFFNFNDSEFLASANSKTMDDMVEDIVNVLGDSNLDDMEISTRKKIDRHSTPPTPSFVKFIGVHKTPKDTERPWQQDNASFTKKLQPCDLKEVLKIKNKKFEDYQKTVCENWLLIYADYDLPYGRLRCPENGDSEWPCSKFERTFVFCSGPNKFLIQLDGHGGILILTPNLESGF